MSAFQNHHVSKQMFKCTFKPEVSIYLCILCFNVLTFISSRLYACSSTSPFTCLQNRPNSSHIPHPLI